LVGTTAASPRRAPGQVWRQDTDPLRSKSPGPARGARCLVVHPCGHKNQHRVGFRSGASSAVLGGRARGIPKKSGAAREPRRAGVCSRARLKSTPLFDAAEHADQRCPFRADTKTCTLALTGLVGCYPTGRGVGCDGRKRRSDQMELESIPWRILPGGDFRTTQGPAKGGGRRYHCASKEPGVDDQWAANPCR